MPSREPTVHRTPRLTVTAGNAENLHPYPAPAQWPMDSHPDLGSSRLGSGAAGRWPLPMTDAACLSAIRINDDSSFFNQPLLQETGRLATRSVHAHPRLRCNISAVRARRDHVSPLVVRWTGKAIVPGISRMLQPDFQTRSRSTRGISKETERQLFQQAHDDYERELRGVERLLCTLLCTRSGPSKDVRRRCTAMIPQFARLHRVATVRHESARQLASETTAHPLEPANYGANVGAW